MGRASSRVEGESLRFFSAAEKSLWAFFSYYWDLKDPAFRPRKVQSHELRGASDLLRLTNARSRSFDLELRPGVFRFLQGCHGSWALAWSFTESALSWVETHVRFSSQLYRCQASIELTKTLGFLGTT